MKKKVLYCSIKTAVFTTVLLQYLYSKCCILDTKKLHTTKILQQYCTLLQNALFWTQKHCILQK